MDNSQWYAITVAGIAAIVLLFYIFIKAFDIVDAYVTFYFLKHFFYHQLPKYLRLWSTTTWYDFVVIFVYLVGNAVCLYIGVNGRKDLVRRTGLLSTVNLTPLALGGHMNIVINRLGLGLEAYNRIHRWVARVAVIEGLLHTVLAVTSQAPNLHSSTQIAAVVAASAMVSVVITSSSMVRRHFYETFLILHRTLGVVIVAGVCVHIPRKVDAPPMIYLIVMGGLWIVVRLLRFVHMLFRNLRNGKHLCRAAIWSLPDAHQVHVKVSRSWDFGAGQYVYLCIPRASRGDWLQSHPYFVSWWYRNEKGDDIIVFIVRRQKGLSTVLGTHSSGNLICVPDSKEGKEEGKEEGDRRLLLATDLGIQPTELSALIEGPYGHDFRLDKYGTILLFATDEGIAGQLPYIRQFLQRFHNWDVKARRIVLFWEVSAESHMLWVGNWMTDLLAEDTKYALEIRVFVTGNFVTKGVEYGMTRNRGSHDRLQISYCKDLDVHSLIRSELNGRKGRSIISMCVRNSVGTRIRKVVRKTMEKGTEDIHLREMPYQPL